MFLALLLGIGCGSANQSAQKVEVPGSIDQPQQRDPEWVEAIRDGRRPKAVDVEDAKSWLGKHLTNGMTTKQQVLDLFGLPGRNSEIQPGQLDRPKRDGVKTIQYRLWEHDPVNWGYLVLHIDAKTDVLETWEISHSVCGFCPHTFAFDGDWRLEGKMLAGCVGADRAGTDTLILPRLKPTDGSLLVRLSNLAPEIDHVSDMSLAAVSLDDDEELDVSPDGELVVWRPLREISIQRPRDNAQHSTMEYALEATGDVIVLEVRNTAAFEVSMRKKFLHREPDNGRTALSVSFGQGPATEVQPVGTKFLRRVVIPLPETASRVTLQSEGGFWFVRRLWIGKQSPHQTPPQWQRPGNANPANLAPGEYVDLDFPCRWSSVDSSRRTAFALRLRGHYEFPRHH